MCGGVGCGGGHLLVLLQGEVVDVSISAALQPFQQLTLDGLVQPSCDLCLGFSPLFSLLCPVVARRMSRVVGGCQQSVHEARMTAHLAGMVMSSGRDLSASLRMRIRYCVILVRRCLFLCTRNLGQNSRC
jgi:hypothetical protein